MSERQKMFINYIRDGTVPEDYYVIRDKNGNIQFRRKKLPVSAEAIKRRIQEYESKIYELKLLLKLDNDSEEEDEDKEDNAK